MQYMPACEAILLISNINFFTDACCTNILYMTLNCWLEIYTLCQVNSTIPLK